MTITTLVFLLLPVPSEPSSKAPDLPFTDPPKASRPAAEDSAYRMVRCKTGAELSLSQLATELADRDTVFFGEVHDNEKGHRVYAELAQLLAERRSDLVIAMEMFERDVQGVVNDYLRGRIDEATFLKHSRPWKNYTRDYKPLIELARTKKLDVIAGNLPRPVAGKLANKDGSWLPFLPRSTTAPQDRYWELFADVMKNHPEAKGGAEGMYRAQCAKDDAMAESIADYLGSNPHRQPFVIQCNGNFHSDYGFGTAARFAQRVPIAQTAIISMVAVPDVNKADLSAHLKKAHYLLVVPEPPKSAAEKKEPKPADQPKKESKGEKKD